MLFPILAIIVVVTSATRVCQTCWPQEIFTHPAVGLDFDTNHGRAIFKWPNGTIEEVVSIEGDAEYIAMMFEIAGCQDQDRHLEKARHTYDTTAGGKDHQQPISIKQTTISTRFQVCNSTTDGPALDTINGDTIPFSLLEPLESMAHNLALHIHRRLIISHHTLAILGVSYPTFFTARLADLLQAIIQADKNLRPSLSYVQKNAAIGAASANYIRICRCPASWLGCTEAMVRNLKLEMLLHIDYDGSDGAVSGALLTVSLLEAFNPVHWHDGGISWVARPPTPETLFPLPEAIQELNLTDFWDGVASTIRKMVSEYALNRRIDYLVLSGSRAADHSLQQALQTALAGFGQPRIYGITDNIHDTADDGEPGTKKQSKEAMANPTLAPAIGVADLSWRSNMRSCLDLCSGPRRYLPECHEKSMDTEDKGLWILSEEGDSEIPG